MTFEELARSACEEEKRREQEALSLAPAVLGHSGACHVVARILKTEFPSYRAVGIRRDGMLKHVGCIAEDRFIDIHGIRPLPSEQLEDLEPLSLVEENRQLRGLLLSRKFVEAAEVILLPYIKSRISEYDLAKSQKG